MAVINIDELHRELRGHLPESSQAAIEIRVIGESGISIKIDGGSCLTTIGVWPNGCCDVDYLFVETERGEFAHFEFEQLADAVATVTREIGLAIERMH